jgi:hypothetical protein
MMYSREFANRLLTGIYRNAGITSRAKSFKVAKKLSWAMSLNMRVYRRTGARFE